MWIFHPDCGFISAVMKPEGQVTVRARRKADLVRFHEIAKLGKTAKGKQAGTWGPIIRTERNDYRWRMILTPKEWIDACKALADRVTYNNVKGRVQATGDRDLHDAMAYVWTIMRRLQDTEDKEE